MNFKWDMNTKQYPKRVGDVENLDPKWAHISSFALVFASLDASLHCLRILELNAPQPPCLGPHVPGAKEVRCAVWKDTPAGDLNPGHLDGGLRSAVPLWSPSGSSFPPPKCSTDIF